MSSKTDIQFIPLKPDVLPLVIDEIDQICDMHGGNRKLTNRTAQQSHQRRCALPQRTRILERDNTSADRGLRQLLLAALPRLQVALLWEAEVQTQEVDSWLDEARPKHHRRVHNRPNQDLSFLCWHPKKPRICDQREELNPEFLAVVCGPVEQLMAVSLLPSKKQEKSASSPKTPKKTNWKTPKLPKCSYRSPKTEAFKEVFLGCFRLLKLQQKNPKQ